MSYISPFTGDVVQPTDVSYEQIALTSTTGTIQLVWPVNGNLSTDTPAARIMNVSTTSTSYELWMPPASQVSVGQDALIKNTGGVQLTVKTFDGNGTIITINPGIAKYIYLTDNSTNYGTWANVEFGAGTSSADATTLAGYGLKAISSTLNQSHPVLSTGSPFTASALDRAKNYVWTGGVGTITLPVASTLGNDWFMMLRNGGTGALTISPSSSELINGSSSLIMQIADSAFIVCSGSAFFTVGLGRSTTFAFSVLAYPITSAGTPYTLTPAQAQNTIISLTGTLTTPVTVNVPAAVQVYYILNGSTGSTVTFTTGVVGGANVTINANTQAILICDATNVFNAATLIVGNNAISLIDGSVGAPSLNFGSELTTGMYKASTGEIGFAVLGVNEFLLSANGLIIPSGIAGGTFS